MPAPHPRYANVEFEQKGFEEYPKALYRDDKRDPKTPAASGAPVPVIVHNEQEEAAFHEGTLEVGAVQLLYLVVESGGWGHFNVSPVCRPSCHKYTPIVYWTQMWTRYLSPSRSNPTPLDRSILLSMAGISNSGICRKMSSRTIRMFFD